MVMTVATAKGQVVIPSKIRRRYKIKKGTRFSVVEREDGIELKPLTEEYFEKMAGIVKTKQKLTDILFEERRKEKELEDKKWSKS